MKKTFTKTKLGPLATVSEHQTRKIQAAFYGITEIAVEYTYKTNSYDTLPVDELIVIFAELAGFAYTSQLLLKSTRNKGIENHDPGPLAHITHAKAKYAGKLLKEVQELAVDGLNRAKDKQKIKPQDFFSHFSMIKKHGKELEGVFASGDEEKS